MTSSRRLPRRNARPGGAAAIARFSVLTHRDREVELGDVVRRLGASGVSEGYRVRLSGPWPAYRFGGLPSERVASA